MDMGHFKFGQISQIIGQRRGQMRQMYKQQLFYIFQVMVNYLVG
jgi:hypothetical protein